MSQYPGDIHTHIWLREHMSDSFASDLRRVWPDVDRVDASPDVHWRVVVGTTRRSVVLAFDARHAGIMVPDEYVAEYVQRDPGRLVGFTSVDPMRPDALDRLTHGVEGLGLRGVKLAPTYQGFDPLCSEAFALYARIEAYDLPIIWHQGATFVRNSVLKYALPYQIDEIARTFPKMRIMIAHMGQPWIDECIVVVRKHPNVFADVSGLEGRPRLFRNALLNAAEYGVGKKLLFGTDYPFATAEVVDRALERTLGDNPPDDLARLVEHVRSADPFETVGF
ncbi:putative TIM-barrel fold metal-dependent hydrolase [Mesorhizobium robiniae]|uniref:TIM-barrel fold metal-dependent hydrolase n=1 Tax=Mesorhizobium robiniae TaxID=559315 RepID=A0ABV2GG22_9HYPH